MQQPSAPLLYQTGTVMAYSLSHPQPSARCEPQTWLGALSATSVVEAEEAVAHASRIAGHSGGNVQITVVNNLHLHQHVGGGRGTYTNQGAVIINDDEQSASQAQLMHFHPNDPEFRPCTFSPQGLDFGRKLVSRLYKAQKHVNSQYNTITYTQCPGRAQAISHALTLNLSNKRSKNAIFLFDCSLELASLWPSTIHFSEMESLIRQLGPDYEFHRRKVRGRGFSLYFYVIKRIGVRFSAGGRQTWSSLSEWVNSLRDSVENGHSAPSSTQVFTQALGIGLSILGAL